MLLITEDETWTRQNEQLTAPAEKLKNYTAYALDGQLVQE